MSTREVVTLQFGHYANFIGTHWWNLQESSFVYDVQQQQKTLKEINHDVLFREGRNLMGDVTFTPRLVCVDLKGSLNSLKQEGTLYDVKHEADVKWVSDVTLHEASSVQKNEFLTDLQMLECQEDEISKDDVDDVEMKDISSDKAEVVPSPRNSDINKQIFGPRFYDLDDEVKVWSDFLSTHLHRRSITIVEEYHMDAGAAQFDVFGYGTQLMSMSASAQQIEDKIHFFTEECDQLQGFHILTDTYDGFGGLASHVLQELDDDFSNKGRLTFGVTPAMLTNEFAHQSAHYVINAALSCEKLSNHGSLFCPVSMATQLFTTPSQPSVHPYLNYKSDIDYHTSAVLAAALDTMSLPYRLDSHPAHLNDITNTFGINGRKVAALSASFPFPIQSRGTLVETLMSQKGELPWRPLTPYVSGSADPTLQSVVIRGIPDAMLKRLTPSADIPSSLSDCRTVDDVLQLYLTETFPKTMNAGSAVSAPCHVTSPFPHIFDGDLTTSGLVSDTERAPRQGVSTVPMMTSFQSTPDVHGYLNKLVSAVSKYQIRKYHKFLEAGSMEEDDYAESIDNLRHLTECYENSHSDL